MSSHLSHCIRDGTFPDSDDLLSKDVSSDDMSSLLASISQTKNELKDEIGAASQTMAGDVDGWIAQAKKIQEDIVRCKVEARNIVEEHQRGELFRNAVKDTSSKVRLLEAEIAFTKSLEHEIQNISDITQTINEARHDLSVEDPVAAVGKLISIEAALATISAGRTRSMISRLFDELRQQAQAALEKSIETRWTFTTNGSDISLLAGLDPKSSSSEDVSRGCTKIDHALVALQELRVLPSATALISHTIESFLRSIISTSTPLPSSLDRMERKLMVSRAGNKKNVQTLLPMLREIINFLYQTLPEKIRDDVAHQVFPKIVPTLIPVWLDPALPHNLHNLPEIGSLEDEVSALATTLGKYSWPGEEVLKEWIEQIPRNWLTKRRVTSLEAVRKAFSLASGGMRPVERIERQIVTPMIPEDVKEEGDWNANWDDEQPKQEVKEKESTDEDEVSGWDFDTEDEEDKSDKKQETSQDDGDEDDTGDAWGWGDDENAKEELQESKSSSKPKAQQTNGESVPGPKAQEMVLTEVYHITDIPDYIVETIGKDIADAHELQNSSTKYFDTNAPAIGLLSLPNLILALFRATAQTYYSLPSARYTLSNLNLYNDTLYIIQKLTESADASSTTLQPAIQSLNKYARQVYSAELDIQRTILTDLLDGAQGFERCTTFPNSQACTDAVSSTVDRLRQLHADWSRVLGESHLLQSLGSLVTTVFGKVIKDIEDMDDIAEQDSKQLVAYCQQILAVEELFVSSSKLPDLTMTQSAPSHMTSGSEMGHDGESTRLPSQILLYVPNYLRFQYLQQILESSLVDIKYLWTEGELGLEFSTDEVIDLIEALFAESQYRRDAIRSIKGSASG